MSFILNKTRKLIRLINRKRLTNSNFTLITNNCVGGVMCHDLHLRFNSPTVNLDFDDDEFIIFCQHLEYYLSMPIVEIKTDKKFPVGIIKGKYGNVRIYFRHYETFEEAVRKWQERSNRINWNNIYVIMEGGFASEQNLKDFENLPFQNKVVYTCGNTSNIHYYIAMPSRFYSEGFFCGRLLQYEGKLIHKNFEVLDFVHFLNTGKIRKTFFAKILKYYL